MSDQDIVDLVHTENDTQEEQEEEEDSRDEESTCATLNIILFIFFRPIGKRDEKVLQATSKAGQALETR